MARSRGRELSVGALAALALLVFAFGVMAVGEQSSLFSPKKTFRANFKDTVGLKVGSPIWMSGVLIGSVTQITLPTAVEASGIEVELGIKHRYAERIREDSTAGLDYLQLLSGEKYVEITPGTPEFAPLAEGSLIPRSDKGGFFEEGEEITQNVNAITSSLRQVLDALTSEESLLGEMINNPEFGKPGVEALSRTMQNLEHVTDELKEGRGFVGRLLMDPEFADSADSVKSTLESLSRVVADLEAMQKDMAVLMGDEGALSETAENLRVASGSLKRSLERLESPDSLPGRMLYDAEYSRQMTDDLAVMTRNLREITDKINRGEGTIGALIAERTVHDGLEEIVAGVNDSKFARWLMRRYQKKGIKKEDREVDGGS